MNLKKTQRAVINEYERTSVNELIKHGDCDQNYFWRTLSKMSKGKNKMLTPFITNNGNILTNGRDIKQAWANYFKNLYTPDDMGYDNNHKQYIEHKLAEYEAIRPELSTRTVDNISEDDVEQVVKHLKRHKAAGWDNIQNEHLIYGGQYLPLMLAKLFTMMMKIGHYPIRLKKGIIATIPKPGKDSSNPDNNRGITLLPTVAKVFDKVILNRYKSWFVSTLTELQGATGQNNSSTHTTLVLQQ